MKKSFSTCILAAMLAVMPPALGEWEAGYTEDKMDGEISGWANSPFAEPDRKLDFPYNDLRSRIAIHYDGAPSIQFSFTSNAVIGNAEYNDGFYEFTARVRFNNDDSPRTYHFTKLPNSPGIFMDKEQEEVAFIEAIKSNSSVLVEWNWYGQGYAYFNYDLTGANKAMAEAAAFVENKNGEQ